MDPGQPAKDAPLANPCIEMPLAASPAALQARD